LHRRIEINNPGNLPPGLTFEDIRRGVSKLQSGYALESCGSFFTLAISLAARDGLT